MNKISRRNFLKVAGAGAAAMGLAACGGSSSSSSSVAAWETFWFGLTRSCLWTAIPSPARIAS